MLRYLLNLFFNLRKDTYPIYAPINKKTKGPVKVAAPGKPDNGNAAEEWQEFNNE